MVVSTPTTTSATANQPVPTVYTQPTTAKIDQRGSEKSEIILDLKMIFIRFLSGFQYHLETRIHRMSRMPRMTSSA